MRGRIVVHLPVAQLPSIDSRHDDICQQKIDLWLFL